VSGLGVGVSVQELIQSADGVGVRLPGLPCSLGAREGQGVGLPATEPDVEVNLVGSVDGYVLDDQSGDALAFTLGGGGV
jgi:hypothetical protein